MGLYHCIYRVDRYLIELSQNEVFHTLEQAFAMWFMCNQVEDFREFVGLF